MKVDFIIVGQGLAGTLLAHKLIALGKSVIVFDDPNHPKSSDVAAGLVNPVVFRRMTKSWLVDDAFPEMELTYQNLEKLLNERLYFPAQINRILGKDGADFWREKVQENHLESFVNAEPNLVNTNKNTIAPFGFGQVTRAGRLDLQKLISSFSEYLLEQDSIRKEKFEYENLKTGSDWVIYNELTAGKIIFCEGPSASANPYFRDLKFKHSKGEILELKIPDLKLTEIISSDVFVMPLGQNSFKVGATYSWDELNGQITQPARDELWSKFKNMVTAHSEITGQKAGIRPTMHDRKPVIGLLPGIPQIGIFNGLGSKGVLLGPYFATQFAQFLCKTPASIHPEVSIDRYFRKK